MAISKNVIFLATFCLSVIALALMIATIYLPSIYVIDVIGPWKGCIGIFRVCVFGICHHLDDKAFVISKYVSVDILPKKTVVNFLVGPTSEILYLTPAVIKYILYSTTPDLWKPWNPDCFERTANIFNSMVVLWLFNYRNNNNSNLEHFINVLDPLAKLRVPDIILWITQKWFWGFK